MKIFLGSIYVAVAYQGRLQEFAKGAVPPFLFLSPYSLPFSFPPILPPLEIGPLNQLEDLGSCKFPQYVRGGVSAGNESGAL